MSETLVEAAVEVEMRADQARESGDHREAERLTDIQYDLLALAGRTPLKRPREAGGASVPTRKIAVVAGVLFVGFVIGALIVLPAL